MATKPDFWVILEFKSERAKEIFEGFDDMSQAPYRPHFDYDSGFNSSWDIWPVVREGNEVGMFTLNRDLWENIHKHNLLPGTEFTLGKTRSGIQAIGVVTRISTN